MTRRKKLLLNTIAAFGNQLITLVCGFILPKLIISHYGSATNGLLSSITHFLAFFSMMEMGVGAVVRASLYKPLADNDQDEVSRILISSRRFFRRIGFFLCLYTAGLMLYFPLAVDHSHGYLSTALLVGAASFSALSNYLFGIVYQQLLTADQRSYVQLGFSALATLLNTLFGAVLIHLNAGIETVRLAAAVVLLIRPLLQKLYVDRHYQLNLKLPVVGEPIKQKWNGLAQHIATYVVKHADVVILTWFSSLENVSVYYVYHLVTNGLYQILSMLTNGVVSLMGNMLSKGEWKKLRSAFELYETGMHLLVTAMFTTAGVMIFPFISVYMNGVSDVNYFLPVFSALIILAYAASALRLPYNAMVLAAGRFKETQHSSVWEALLNVILSVLFVSRYGLAGVAMGTLCAMLYRTVWLAWYLRRDILNRPFRLFVKHMAADVIAALIILASTRWMPDSCDSWLSFFVRAAAVFAIAAAETLAVGLLFHPHLVRRIRRRLAKAPQNGEDNA